VIESAISEDLRASLSEFTRSAQWRKTTLYPPHLEHEYILGEKYSVSLALLVDAINRYGHNEIFYSKS
jgi:hypothetical protein